MPPVAGLVIDIALLAALAAAVWRGWHLSKQFEKLQADRAAFEQLIQALNLAAARAEAVIGTLKNTALQSADTLQTKVGAARALAEELEIMVQAGDNLAERLQKLAETSRQAATAAAPAPAAFAEEKTEDKGAQPRTKAEKELLEAVKARKS